MKISRVEAVTMAGLCVLFAGAGNAAFAQGYDHGQYGEGQTHYGDSQRREATRMERRRLDRLHAVYAHAATSGNYSAAERAHLHAEAIRARLHAQRERHDHFRHDMHHDSGY